MTKHEEINLLAKAWKELFAAREYSVSQTAIDHITEAMRLLDRVGKELGVDILTMDVDAMM